MFNFTEEKLAGRSRAFRYLFHVVSGFRFVSYRAWREAGEPNPFVTKTYTRRHTERVEFVDIFGEELDRSSPRSRR